MQPALLSRLACGLICMSTFLAVCTYRAFNLPALFSGLSRIASNACTVRAAAATSEVVARLQIRQRGC